MIELRWLEKKKVTSLTTYSDGVQDSIVGVEKVLQYRQYRMGPEVWSEWRDIPKVREDE